jgi:transposase InsO family protein
MRKDHPVRRLCLYLKASPSGFYDWVQRQAHPCARALENQSLAREIKSLHAHSRETYGSPRIVHALRQKGRRHGRQRIARLMKAEGLCGRQKRRYRVKTTDSHHDHPIARRMDIQLYRIGAQLESLLKRGNRVLGKAVMRAPV